MQVFTAASHYLGGKYLPQATLYVTLEPCVMCAGAAYWTQLGRLVYGAVDEQRGFQKNQLGLHPKTSIESGVMQDECRQLLVDFFKKKR